MSKEKVNHPDHYCYSKFEPKDVIREWGLNFNLGSAVKYISRAGRKDDIIQDLKKAQQFIQFEIEAIEAERISKVHLCKSCKKEFPTCDGYPTFGNGVGADNVCECSGYVNWDTNSPKYDFNNTKEKPVKEAKQAVPKHPNCKCSFNPVFMDDLKDALMYAMSEAEMISVKPILVKVPDGVDVDEFIKNIIGGMDNAGN